MQQYLTLAELQTVYPFWMRILTTLFQQSSSIAQMVLVILLIHAPSKISMAFSIICSVLFIDLQFKYVLQKYINKN